MTRTALAAALVALCFLCSPAASAALVTFFNPDQTAIVTPGVTSDTYQSEGYLFSVTRDKLFTGGLGPDPIGRYIRIPWPEGLEAQAVTAGPNPSKAQITLRRVDGDVFDIPAFTIELLASTAGTGGHLEVMPLVNGEDAFNDPLFFNASGSAGLSFSYDASTPAYLGNTEKLKGYDTYKMTLFVDYALTALSLEGAPVPEPASLAPLSLLALLAARRRP